MNDFSVRVINIDKIDTNGGIFVGSRTEANNYGVKGLVEIHSCFC